MHRNQRHRVCRRLSRGLHPPEKGQPKHATEEMLYIDPVECIDCGACVPVCPVSAIFALDDLPEKWSAFTERNAKYFAPLKLLVERAPPPALCTRVPANAHPPQIKRISTDKAQRRLEILRFFSPVHTTTTRL